MREHWINFEPETRYGMIRNFGARLTICRLLKEIYRDTNDEEIRIRCRVAISIARSICGRMNRYEGERWGTIQYPRHCNAWEELRRKALIPDGEGNDGNSGVS